MNLQFAPVHKVVMIEHFPDLSPNLYDNLNNMKLDLNIPTKAKFSANEQSHKFKVQGK